MQEKEQNFSPVKQRILSFAGTLGISKRDFYTKIGVSRGTLENKSGITEDVLAKFIATYPGVSINWLMTGEGEMLLPATGASPVPSETAAAALPASLSCKTAEERVSELERQNAVLTRSLDLLTRQLEALLERQRDG